MNVNAKLVSPEVHRPQVQGTAGDAEHSAKIQCERLEKPNRSTLRNRRAAAIEVGIAKFIHLRETMSALRCNYLVHHQGLSPGIALAT